MLFDSDKYKLMKGFKVKLIAGSANPLVNRPNDKYVRSEDFFIMINGAINPLKLKRKSLYKILNVDNATSAVLDGYVSSNSLSLKNINDVITLLEYYDSI
jgi:hypothetical protein